MANCLKRLQCRCACPEQVCEEWTESTALHVRGREVITARGTFNVNIGNVPVPGQKVLHNAEGRTAGARPQMRGARMRRRVDEPFIPSTPVTDPLPLPVPPLIAKWHRPHAPLLPNSDHLMSVPGYPKETGQGFRPDWPLTEKPRPVPENRLDDVWPLKGFEYNPRVDHFALRWRDGAMQAYAAGMADGKRYLRVPDVPVIVAGGNFFLRRDPGRWVPFENGVGWAIPNENLLRMYLENTVLNADVKVYQGHGDQLTIFGGKWWLDGDHAFPMFGLQEDVLRLGELPFRQACQAALESVQIGVKRFYEDGTVEEEEPLPGFDLTLYPPSFPGAVTTVDTWWSVWQSWVEGSEGNINSGYKQGTTTINLENPGWREVPDMRSYWWEPRLTASFTSGPKAGHEKDIATALLGTEINILSFTADSEQGRQPPILADGSLPERFPVKMRFPADAEGNPAPWMDEYAGDYLHVLRGRLIYEGELGELPAPRSSITRTWAGIEVDGTGDFTADCWLEGTVRYAVVVYADGRVAGSIKKGDRPAQVWQSTLESVWPDAPDLTGTIPIVNYSFMVQGWPFRAGTLAWLRFGNGYSTPDSIINVRVRKEPGGRKVRLLLARNDDKRMNIMQDSYRQNLLPVERYLKPVDAGKLDLNRLTAPGPAEKDFKRVQLVSAEGPVQLTFTPPEGEYPEGQTIRKRLSELEFVMPLNQATEFTPPDGWQKQLSRKLGKHHVIVQLTIPDEQQTETTITLTFPPKSRFGHPRARLRLTQQEAW